MKYLILLLLSFLLAGCINIQPPSADAHPDKRLIYAAHYGDLPMAQKAIKDGANLNTTDGLGYSAVFNTIWHNNPEVLKLLIKSGANMKLLNPRGHTVHDAANSAEKYNHQNVKRIREILKGIK